MKKLFALMLAIMLVLTTAGCRRNEEPTANKDKNAADKDGNYHVALCLPFTGGSQSYAKYIEMGVNIALKQLEKQGWLNGDGTGKIIIHKFDDTDVATEGAAIAEQVVASTDPFYLLEIGSFRSDVSLACVKTYRDAEMPQYALTSSHKDFLPSSGDWGFSLSMTQDIAASRVAAYDIKYLGFTKIALIYSNDSWGNETKTYYTAQAEKFGVKLLASEGYETGTQDFKSILTGIKEANPELVMCFCAETDIVLIREQAEQIGLKCKWQVSSKSRTANVLNNLIEKGLAYDQYGIYAQSKNLKDPVYIAYEEIYKELYPEVYAEAKNTTQKYADQGYNCMSTVIWAIKETMKGEKGTTRQTFRDKLATLNGFHSVQGNLTFAEGRKILQIQYLSEIVPDGEGGYKWINYEDIPFDADKECGFK